MTRTEALHQWRRLVVLRIEIILLKLLQLLRMVQRTEHCRDLALERIALLRLSHDQVLNLTKEGRRLNVNVRLDVQESIGPPSYRSL